MGHGSYDTYTRSARASSLGYATKSVDAFKVIASDHIRGFDIQSLDTDQVIAEIGYLCPLEEFQEEVA
jgi:hypothetical protein